MEPNERNKIYRLLTDALGRKRNIPPNPSIKYLLKSIIGEDPDSGSPVKVTSVRGAEAGLDHLEIITQSKESKWRHRIYTEEI